MYGKKASSPFNKSLDLVNTLDLTRNESQQAALIQQ